MEHKFFIFSLEGHRYAIHLQVVDRVVPAVEITPVPDKGDFLLGIINLQGRVIPVMNVREKLGLHHREIALDDKIIIVKVMKWTIAFVVDSVEGVIDRSNQEITPSADIMPILENTEGVVKIDNDMALIYNLEGALSFEEKGGIEEVMESNRLIEKG